MTAMGVTAAIVAAALLGFRHGVDYDHVAAIADLTASTPHPRRAVWLAILYGLGHALAIVILGALAVGFGAFLPASSDRIAETLVGITLVVLGCFVLNALATNPGGVPPVTRFVLISRGSRWVVSRILKIAGRAPAVPLNSAATPGEGSAFGIGIVHGIGAETPSQLSLFVLSAGVGGWGSGLMCVVAFAAGLLAMNTAMAIFSTGTFRLSSFRVPVYRAVMAIAGGYSVVIGAAFIASAAGVPLPV
ncbi:MAG TPA: hypothetical protein VMT58_08225 [Candidatus Binataceae bacterium]|nr:hypothetical protein [Candidatus Binataceae bacterium]